MNDNPVTEDNHPYLAFPHLWESSIAPPELADPDEPQRIMRSHLQKIELGKSSSSCRVAFITRLHRKAALQEFWCASFEEAQVYLNLAAHPEVVNFKEQLTRIPFVKADGRDTHTLVDAHVLLRNGDEVLVSVKYDEKANRGSYLKEVANIASQVTCETAGRIVVASRFSFHPAYRQCAQAIHKARRGWDPEADSIVLEAANDLGSRFTFKELVDVAAISGRGHRAAIRLIGDGDIGKHPLDGFAADTELWRAAA